MGVTGISITLRIVAVFQLKLLVSFYRWLPQLWELPATRDSIDNGGYPCWTFSLSFSTLHSWGTSLLAASCRTSPTFLRALKVEKNHRFISFTVWFFHFRYTHLLSWHQPSYLRKHKPSTWSIILTDPRNLPASWVFFDAPSSMLKQTFPYEACFKKISSFQTVSQRPVHRSIAF